MPKSKVSDSDKPMLCLYKGDTCLGIFENFEAIAKFLDVKVETARFYASPVYKRRSGKGSYDNRLIVIRC